MARNRFERHWVTFNTQQIAPRHSLVTSSTMLRTRKRRPFANWS